MKKASIISIGNELLCGRTVDTNSTFLAGELFTLGIPVVSFYTIADEIEAIVRALNSAANDADVILVTGGLGPTDDDLTRQGFAEFLSVELKLDKNLLLQIEEFFAGRGIDMPERNKIQAYIPFGAEPLINNLGTAPGIMAKSKDRIFFSMPGVPSEMKEMFSSAVSGTLKQFAAGQAVVIKRLNCFGAGESTIAEAIGSLMDRGRSPLINCTVHYGIITLHIIASAEKREDALEMVEKDEKLLRQLLGDLVFGTNEQTLAEVVGKKLAQNKKTLATAESCTGGLIAKLITDIPGASEYFLNGWVTYTNGAKTAELAVPADLIQRYGAVSEQIAACMAESAKKKARADFAIAVTGIAGPAGATEQKPVGLVYISIASDNNCRTHRFVFSHDRDSIRLRSAQTALNLLRLELKNLTKC